MSDEREEKLKEKVSLLEKFGMMVEFVSGYQVVLPIPSHIDFGWSLEDWASLTRRDGYDYIGGCCGTMSYVQDIICEWWRANEPVRINDVYEVVRALHQHAGGDKSDSPWQYALTSQVPETVAKLISEKSELEPWDRVAIAWHMLKDFVDLGYDLRGSREDKTEVEQAIATLGQSARYLDLCSLFRNGDSTEAQRLNDRASTLLQAARMRPALVTVLSGLEQIVRDPVEGFAIEQMQGGTETDPKWTICTNNFGLAVFPTEEEANNIIKASYESRAQYQAREPDHFRVRHVRIEMRDSHIGEVRSDGFYRMEEYK